MNLTKALELLNKQQEILARQDILIRGLDNLANALISAGVQPRWIKDAMSGSDMSERPLKP